MNAPAAQTFPPASNHPFETTLEAVETGLALGRKADSGDPSGEAIRETVESAGGVLLFQMKLDEGEAGHWVAAAAFGEGEAREIAVIDLPCSGGGATVSPAARSDLPIASIAVAYAGLAECWGKAA